MNKAYKTCIDACLQCAAACDYCFSSCLKEVNVDQMTKCMQLDVECAAICRTAAQLMSVESEYANAICELSADVCNACANECKKHQMDHCKKCAEVCSSCAEKCTSLIAA